MNNQIVYVLTKQIELYDAEGCPVGESTEILCVFSTRELADKAQERAAIHRFIDVQIEEWKVDG